MTKKKKKKKNTPENKRIPKENFGAQTNKKKDLRVAHWLALLFEIKFN